MFDFLNSRGTTYRESIRSFCSTESCSILGKYWWFTMNAKEKFAKAMDADKECSNKIQSVMVRQGTSHDAHCSNNIFSKTCSDHKQINEMFSSLTCRKACNEKHWLWCTADRKRHCVILYRPYCEQLLLVIVLYFYDQPNLNCTGSRVTQSLRQRTLYRLRKST